MNAQTATQTLTAGTRVRLTSGLNAGHTATAHTLYRGSWTYELDQANAYGARFVKLAATDADAVEVLA